MPPVLVVGIGQRFRGDDALGLAAVEAWQEQHGGAPQGTEVCLLESPGLQLLERLTGYEAAIIVDAVSSGAEAGTVHRLSESDIAGFGPGSGSAHGLGVAETLSIGRILGSTCLPQQVQIIGIEVGDVGVGQPLSDSGRRSLPAAIRAIDDTLAELNRQPRTEGPDSVPTLTTSAPN